MPTSLKNSAAIAGIGQTEFSKKSGRTELQLASEAGRAAIEDAGMQPSDIDGTVTFTSDTNDELALIRSIGMTRLRWASRTPFGGAGASATLEHAAAAVASGAANNVLIYRAFNERSGLRFGQPGIAAALGNERATWYVPYGLDTPPKNDSLQFQRYMHRYGVTNTDFGRYAVVARKHAATNPNAWYFNRPITIEDHQASRWIVEPVVRLFDCCQESDGGVAVLVTTRDRAKDLRQTPVLIEAASQNEALGTEIGHNYYNPDISRFPEAEDLGRQLWETTGLTPNDISAAMLYDSLSPLVFYQLEAYGFCEPGEAKNFIAEGKIEIGGKLPVNTHGGLLGEAYVHGLNNIVEAVKQVRGTAANQVANADHIMVAAAWSAAILGRM